MKDGLKAKFASTTDSRSFSSSSGDNMIEKLNDKVTRLKSSAATLRKSNPDCIVRTFEQTDNEVFEAISFKGTNHQLLNDIHSLIANIASLKDYLNRWCTQNGVTFNGDSVINSSREAAIVHNLWNIEKHGVLDRSPRSGFTPRIGPISQELLNPNATKTDGIQIKANSYGGADFANLSGEKLIARVRAKVLDDQNSEVGDIVNICELAISAWSAAFRSAGAPVSV
jgi:hypothetical protein